MQSVIEIIENNSLPSDGESLAPFLREDNGNYISQEGLYWDFKREWPFSYSDGYFGGIARLICAFTNTHGGLIIFGVHDETRLAGHNKVVPNMDRLEQALKQLLSDPPSLQLKRYFVGTDEAIDVLLVSPLKPFSMPLRFALDLMTYKQGVIWIRQNSEVLPAEPKHVPMLYCRSGSSSGDDASILLSGGIPPSPATIKRFVGRLSTIDAIFRWIKTSDEPRTFLHGKGGSGKTTIAYEVAKVLKTDGGLVHLGQNQPLDNVIFVSAKQLKLDVISQQQASFVGLDFTDERELYEAILSLASWTSQSLSDLSLEQVKIEIKDLFDLTSNFIVIDDIDTLTTKGLEAGFDFLYSVLWRAKRLSKLLYTTRSAPSHSLANSIEVKGLDGSDYYEFISVCARQFNVPEPDRDFAEGKLATVSERRPLVIESILAIRRNSGSYDRAINLFEEDSGEDVRSYVFRREWNALPADNYGRYVLAVLAIHKDPLTYEDLVSLTRYESSRVKDALGDIREVFLQVNDVSHEATYQLGALTSAFIVEQSKKLDLYSALAERIRRYRQNSYPENPILSRLRDRIESLVFKGSRQIDKELLEQAWQIASDTTLSPKISEDPRFLALQGYVLASQVPPRLDDARQKFRHVFEMKHEPEIDYLKQWFLAERTSRHGLEECLKISDLVINGKRYSEQEKIEFTSKKATNLYNRGKNDLQFVPEKSLRDITEALRLHLHWLSKNTRLASIKIEKSEEYARNTAYVLFDYLVIRGQFDDFIDICKSMIRERLPLDPLEAPLVRSFKSLTREPVSKGEAAKRKNKLEGLAKELAAAPIWNDTSAKQSVLKSLDSAMTT